MAERIWVTAGAPLEDGRGWRLWYSWTETEDFRPEPVGVTLRGDPVSVQEDWRTLPSVAGYARRMGILTLQLPAGSPGDEYELRVPERGDRLPLRWRPLPSTVGEGVSFLMASCFWRYDDKEGAYASAMRDLQARMLPKPAFKVLMGDQLYLDWPVPWLTGKPVLEMFAGRYETYWGDDAYRDALCALPTYYACDDHEFWNNYPELQPQLPYTWKAGSRETSRKTAKELYELYQHGANPDGARFFGFRVDPVSFFVADPRSERTAFKGEGPPSFFSAEQWSALETWAQEIAGPAVLVIGQPLFQKPGDWKDLTLSNFEEDYWRLCGLLEDVQSGRRGDGRRHDVLVLTGDIHTGRYAAATIKEAPGAGPVREFVASPASLVGPYLHEHKPNQPPALVRSPSGRPGRTWEIVVRKTDEAPSVDNNVGAVTMSPGTNGRIRFDLDLYRVRPYDRWDYLHRVFGGGPRTTGARRIFHHEVELQ